MKKILVIALLATAACSPDVRLGTGDYADAATTSYGLSQGFVEANPAVKWSGDAAPVVGLGIKLAAKNALVAFGDTPEQANRKVEAGGWFSACTNILTISGANPAAVVGGSFCLISFLN